MRSPHLIQDYQIAINIMTEVPLGRSLHTLHKSCSLNNCLVVLEGGWISWRMPPTTTRVFPLTLCVLRFVKKRRNYHQA
jgi:hypothetical protein